MMFVLLIVGLFLSVQGIPTHIPGHVNDHEHIIPSHHVSPVTHARLVVESRNQPLIQDIPVNADDGFETPVNADASTVSESVPAAASVELPSAQETPSTEVVEHRNEVATSLSSSSESLPAPPVQEVHHEQLPSQEIVHSEQLPLQQVIHEESKQLPLQQVIHEESIIKDGILPLMSNFPCEGHSRGYFADEMSDCKIFVQCNPNMDPHGFPFMERFLFQCPIMTRFDQRLLTCVRMEEALPCPSSRLYWADTEMRFAAFSDLPMQKIIPIPDDVIKGAPVVQSQIIEQSPAPLAIEQHPIKSAQVIEQHPIKSAQVIEQHPVKSAQVIEQLPQAQFIEPVQKLTQVVEQHPIKSAQVIEPLPQVIEQTPVQKIVEQTQLPTKTVIRNDFPTKTVIKNDFPTKTVIKNDFPTKTVIKNDFPTKTVIRNDFGTKTVQKTISAPLAAVKTIQKTSFPTKTVQKMVTSLPTKTVQKMVTSLPTKTMVEPAIKGMRKTIHTVSQPAMITRTVSHAPVMTRTFFRSPIQHFRTIPGAFVTRIA